MKTNSALYQDFLSGGTIEQYCQSHIDPFQVEMDHLGLNALIDAVIKPAGISVDVLYLDRSETEEVNTINFHVEDPNSLSGFVTQPMIRLLYRPYVLYQVQAETAKITLRSGHYDIIYKIEDMPMAMPAHTAQQVHYMSDPTHTLSSNLAYSQNGLDLDSYFLPGLSSAGISTMPFPNDPYDRHGGYSAMDLPMSPAAVDPFTIPVPPAIHPQPAERLGDSTFRPSKFQVEPEFRQLAITHPEPCQTEAMKQYVSCQSITACFLFQNKRMQPSDPFHRAGECAAHYMNERFQPQIWEPGSEYRSTESQSRRSS